MSVTDRRDDHDADINEASSSSSCGVLIVGAGCAGLTAGYDLKRQGIPFAIVEASDELGGRLQKLEGFADFPIDSGAEFIFGYGPPTLQAIVNDRSKRIKEKVRTCYYDVNPVRSWANGKWKKTSWASEYHKFIHYSWFDFFKDYIAKPILKDIHYGCEVCAIDYSSSSSTIKVSCREGRTFVADQVIVTVPIKILQDGDITFSPELPKAKLKAIENVPYEPGLKMFIEFTEKFYYNGFEINDPKFGYGECFFYDATYQQKSSRNIMALFAFGEQALKYTELEDDDDLIAAILKQLDEAYDGRASQTYVKHFTQNWSKSPYIRGMYASYRKGLRHVWPILQPVDRKLFFAGEALPVDGSSYGMVHGAAFSGRSAAQAVQRVREGKRPAVNVSAFLVHVVSTLCCGLEYKLFFSDDS